MDYKILSIVIAILSAIVSGIVGFFSAKYGLKDFVRDKHEELVKKIHDLEIQLEKLKSKDEVQQTVIESLGRSFQDIVTQINQELKTRKK